MKSAAVALATLMSCVVALGQTTRPPPPVTQQGNGSGNGDANNNGSGGQPRVFPSLGYYQHIAGLYNGEYKAALEGFKLDYSFGLQAAGTHWVDSICYLTMAGECRLKMGQLGDALDDYNAALKLYIAFPNWMAGIRFPTVIRPQAGPRKAPWGTSARAAKTGRFTITSALITDTVLMDPVPAPNGGSNMIAAGTPIQVGVQEIARCAALAMKRRHELMGPLCPQDPLTSALSSLFARRPATEHPVAQAWVDAELGMAYLGNGQTGQATNFLRRAASAAEEFDHPLTPLVLLQLGQLALESGDLKNAANLLEEASYSAFDFGDSCTLEEAFRSGQQTWLAAHPAGPAVFPPLAPAIPWSKTHGRELYASLQLFAAENALLINQPERAAPALAEATSAVARRDMGSRDVGARLGYLTAMVDYRQGRAAAGDQAMADALAFTRSASKWLFQIQLIERYAPGMLSTPFNRKQTLTVFEKLLRDPTAGDWATDPLESIAVLANLNTAAFERWFEAAEQTDVDLSLEVADRIRRRRFFSTLPLGGRLMAMRWLLEAPADVLTPPLQLQRQELLARYPKYGELSERAKKLQAELTAVPLVAGNPDAQRVQSAKLSDLAHAAADQEAMLREMSIRRETAEMAFPPLRKPKEVQAGLQPRQFMLAFLAERDSLHAWMLSKNRCAAWKIESSPSMLEQKVTALLKAIGNVDANYELPPSQLADDAWRKPAREAFEAIEAGSKVNFRAPIDELIIVPDGVLWYLPFEALQVGKDGLSPQASSLLAKSRLRYLPTMGLAAADARQQRNLGRVGLLPSSGRTREESEAAQAAADRMAKLAANVSLLRRPSPAASAVYGSLFDTLMVFDDLSDRADRSPAGEKNAPDRSPYDWSPLPIDRARGSGSLAQWLAAPNKNAAQIMLAGFHTPAENSLRQVTSGPRGTELFLSACSLMAGGARTVLMSRWRTGGASSEELIRQFAAELPYAGAADAWQRSVQMTWDTPLELDREPRIKRSSGGEGATARHPLFWSGFLLLDTGWSPAKPEQLAVKN